MLNWVIYDIYREEKFEENRENRYPRTSQILREKGFLQRQCMSSLAKSQSLKKMIRSHFSVSHFFIFKNFSCFIVYISRIFFLVLVIYFLERGEGRGKERERKINVWLPLTCSPLGTWPTTQVCAPDWESNRQPLGLQACAQSTSDTSQGSRILFNP